MKPGCYKGWHETGASRGNCTGSEVANERSDKKYKESVKIQTWQDQMAKNTTFVQKQAVSIVHGFIGQVTQL